MDWSADDSGRSDAPPPAERDQEPTPSWHERLLLRSPRDKIALAIDAGVVALAVVFVLAQLHPRLLLSDTTPAGGDMGAHVYGPAFLRDHLLPSGRLTGWSPDWYAGFPAYHFYMVVPALLIVAVNAGIQGWGGLIPLAAGAALAVAAVRAGGLRRRLLAAAAIAVVLLGVGLPYGVAFKLVSVLGAVTLPVACYAFGRLAGMPFPGPALLSAGSLLFLFNQEPLESNTGNIIGGNLSSTLAGEFSFGISLSLAVLYLGVVLRGMRTGQHRALAAVLLALTGLCHLIPAIFAILATGVALALNRPWGPRLRWLLPVFPVGGLLGAFWMLPFVWRRPYLNDMGWEKVPAGSADVGLWELFTGHRVAADGSSRRWLWEFVDFLAPEKLRWVVVLACVGAVLSLISRAKVGTFLTLTLGVFAFAFIVMPQGRLWNARLLPFVLLCLFLLAALALGELGRAVATLVAADPLRPVFALTAAVPVFALALAVVVVGLRLGVLPGGNTSLDGSYHWFGFDTSPQDRSSVKSWAAWNYKGYERKLPSASLGEHAGGYTEYHDLLTTMAEVGRDHGCGRAMWEYGTDRLNSYGTPMAPMLLPFWTDGCIASMEGLYFESSATTPFHFLNQSELSFQPSRAQRDLTYSAGLDIEKGVDHLQLMGVRYYMAFSTEAVAAADQNPRLRPITTSGPWRIYEVAESTLVEPLEYEPAVLTGVDAGRGWLEAVEPFYLDPGLWTAFPAADGPEGWTRIRPGETAPRRPLPAIRVSAINAGTDRISFDVDETGVPVLVKASYFPNWKVEGADGPYRIAPNLMVVVPREEHVELYYGWTPVDILAWLLTLDGIALVVLLARARPVRMPEPPVPAGAAGLDEGYPSGPSPDGDRPLTVVGDGPPPEERELVWEHRSST